MSTTPTSSLVDALRQHRLLDAKQLDQLADLQAKFPDPKALARELIRRNWLTPYQANLLLQGKAKDLVLGQHIILERLGEGGMGQVFKARHRTFNRTAAIKLIRKERLENPDAIKRFHREVRAAASLSHPNVVLAYDADEIGGTHLLVMEYIDGANDLNKLVKTKGPLPVAQACEYIRQAALGLQHAFERSMVHRDIKPHNLLLTADGKTVKILDMGLARLDAADGEKSSTMTQEGAIMGTPDYIAPEQALDSHTADIRADIYSLGCTLYYLLTGRTPFQGGTLTEKLLKHQTHEPKAVEKLRGDVPPGVLAVLRKMMAKKPENRYQTPGEVATALESVSSVSSDETIAASGSASVQAKSGDTLDSALSYMAHGGDLAQAEAIHAERKAEARREWKKLRWAGIVAILGLVAVVVAVIYLPKGKPPAPEGQKDDGKQVVKVDEPKEIDLLALIDPKQDAVKGEWKRDGNSLAMTNGGTLQIPSAMPEEYEVEIVATRTGGVEGLAITLVAGSNRVNADLGGWGGSTSGLGKINNFSANQNETKHEGNLFTDGKPTRIICTVRKRQIVVLCDDKTIINWRGDFRRLSPPNMVQLPPDNRNLFLTSSCRFYITKMVLRPLPDSEKAFNDWLASIQKMPADKQVEAVADKLKELNPGFDGKVTHKKDGDVVTELKFFTDNVADISPVRAMKGLKRLTCQGSQARRTSASSGRLSDLRPLQGCGLTFLECSANRVSDLSPLQDLPLEWLSVGNCPVSDLSPLKTMRLTKLACWGTDISDVSSLRNMPLELLAVSDTKISDLSPLFGLPIKQLYFRGLTIPDLTWLPRFPMIEGIDCDFKPYRDTEILRSIKTLHTINAKPAAEFWKDVDAQQTAFDAWCKQVAAMPADKQVDAVAVKLKELNPGFDGKVEHRMDGGKVVELKFPTEMVADISPARALPHLHVLDCFSQAHKGALVDLSPLRGMSLTQFHCYGTKVSDLSPLKGMSLKQFNCGYTPVSDLAPLKGMPLSVLECWNTNVRDLSPLEGMPLRIVNCFETPVQSLMPLKEIPLKTLRFERSKVTDLSPLKGMPLAVVGCDFKPFRDTELLKSIKTLEKINGKPAADFWKDVETKQAAFDAWCKQVAAMPADKQGEAVAAKLKELNPGFDGKVTHKKEGDVVTQVNFYTDNVSDISPVRALTGLKKLYCGGTDWGKGKLSDLSPLKGMGLTFLYCEGTKVSDLLPLKDMKLIDLNCNGTTVSDLSPLQGMPVGNLECQYSYVADLTPLQGMNLHSIRLTPKNIRKGMDVLRQMKSLKTIGIGWQDKDKWPAAEFWKKYDAGEFGKPDVKQAAFDAWCKQVAAMPADKQVEAVTAKLKELNPGFDGKVTHKKEGNVVTLTGNVADISPIGALKDLQALNCSASGPTKGRLADLSPLKGLKLTWLNCGGTMVADLSPLRGMPLVSVGCEYTSVTDLSPLKDMKLSKLWCGDTRTSDLSPLKGMPLTLLTFHNTNVADLSPLKGMPLTYLQFYGGTKVSDLTPLEGMTLEDIRFTPKNITKGLDVLRKMKSLNTIGIGGRATEIWPAAEFWKKYDAGEFKK